MLLMNLYGIQIDYKSALESSMRNEIEGIPSSADIKCGTRTTWAIEAYRDLLDSKLYEAYIQSRQIEPVRDRAMQSPAGYFELHWNDTGNHAVPQEDLGGNGIPDYIDSAAVIFDYVRDIEVNQMGYLPPPGEDGNELIPYPIYFTNHFKYGETIKKEVIEANLPAITYTSYIEVDNDFSEYYFPTQGLAGLKVTAAHEFHHAVQLGYFYRDEDRYFFEMTSTWMEEHIYPDIDDYLYYLDYFFGVVSNSRFDLAFDTYPYANGLYLQLLESKYDSPIVKSIWEKMREDKSLAAIVSTLESHGQSWMESLNEYGLWLYYTGSRAISDKFFTDAAFFPEIQIKSADKIEFETAFVDDLSITKIANRYLEFQNMRGQILDIEVVSDENNDTGFRMITPNSYSQSYNTNHKITSDPIDSEQLILLITNSEEEEIITTTEIVISGSINLTTVYPFPNPLNTRKYETMRFQNVPPEAELNIYNTSGKRVARIKNQGSSRIRSWHLKNDDGEQVAAGIYFFLVQGDGLLKRGKFSIIR